MKNKRETLFKILASLAVFLLTARVGMDGLAPVPLAILAGLTFSGWNVFYLAPTYLIASVATRPTAEGLLIGLVPGVIFIAACVISRASGRRISATGTAICTAVSAGMRFLVEPAPILSAVAYVALSVGLSYAFLVALYALLVRGVGYRLSWDEKVSLAVFVGALTFGVNSLEVAGITPYAAVCAFAVFYTAYAFQGEGVIFALAMGIGGGSAEAVCACVAWFVAVHVFSKHSRGMAGLAMIVIEVLVGALVAEVNAVRVVGVALGALAFCLLPRRRLVKMVSFFGRLGESHAYRSLVNRNRADVRDKIRGVARALYLAEGLGVEPEPDDLDEVKESLCAELEARFCDGCPGKKGCHKLLGGSARSVLVGVVDSALQSGRATVLDLPPYLTGSCGRVERLIDTVNALIGSYKSRLAVKRNSGATKRLVASVMNGIGKMMDEIAETLGVSLGFEPNGERRIADELNYVGVASDSVSVYGEGRETRVCAVVREADEAKHALVNAVQKQVGLPMKVIERKDGGEGRTEVWLAPAPEYEVVVGRASVALKDGECGDTLTGVRLSDGRCLIALSDGMGAGRAADEQSTGLIAIVESFLRAGFSSDTVLPVVNKMMMLGGAESFQTLDLAIVDTGSGNADLIKMGACESLLVRGDEVRVIAGSALPVGILDEIKPHVDRVLIKEGDLLIMYSDGLTDTLGAEVVYSLAREASHVNPQALCDGLIARAKKVGLKDDVSVTAFRVFKARA